MYNPGPMESLEFAGTHQFIAPEMAGGEMKFLGTKGEEILS